MIGYSTFHKASRPEPHHQMQYSVVSRTLIWEGVLSFCRDAVSIFYSPSQLCCCLGLFYTKRFENCIHCMYIVIFLCSYSIVYLFILFFLMFHFNGISKVSDHVYIYNFWYKLIFLKKNIAQLAGAVEHTNCISTERKDPPPQQVSWIWH